MGAMNIINIYENYNLYFNADFKEIFQKLSKTALKSGHKLYLIGGIVRDMLLNKESLDIDITVEGDAIEFAHVLEKESGAKILSIHKNFGTVKVLINDEKIDFASTRSEIYPKKGHLPQVSEIGCSLKKDILRRDFTINSLALSLNQENFANLIDYVDGFKDLKAKKIRILHNQSFIDDPTRIIRALKYSSRLGFELEENTLTLQKEYLKNVNYDMCNKRIKQEIKKTFSDCGQETFNKFIEQGIYKLVVKKEVENPSINIENLIEKYKSKHSWLVYLGIIKVGENIDKLELTKAEKDIIISAENLIKINLKDDFAIYKAFSSQKIETLLILVVLGKEKEVFRYLDYLQKIKLHISGNDLLKLGLVPSKAFSEAFDYVLREKIKKPQMKKSDELELVKEYL